MPYVTRDELLGSFQRRYRDVPLSGGRVVRLQNLSEKERCRIEAPRLAAKNDDERLKAMREEPCRWLIETLVDADGKRLFTKDDLADLLLLDSADTRALYVAAQEHCWGGTPESVEDHEKNSGAMSDDCSPSG